MNQSALKQYLESGEAPVEIATVVNAAVALAVQDPIAPIVVDLMAVKMLAKDLHYRARGKSFYAIHQLADVLWQTSHALDELFEVYYLGERKSVPPLMCAFVGAAVSRTRAALMATGCTADETSCGEDRLMEALAAVFRDTVSVVENAKKAAVFHSGTGAVLDEISKSALQGAGLLARTDSAADKGLPNEA